MKQIIKLRKEIDKIDHKIMNLVKKRLAISRKIIKEKKKSGIKACDRKRENEVINNVLRKAKLKNRLIRNIYSAIFFEARGKVK